MKTMQNQIVFEVCMGDYLVEVAGEHLSEFITKNKDKVFGYWRKKVHKKMNCFKEDVA